MAPFSPVPLIQALDAVLPAGGQRFTGNQQTCAMESVEGVPAEVRVAQGHLVIYEQEGHCSRCNGISCQVRRSPVVSDILHTTLQMHPDPILHVSLHRLPLQAPPVDIALLLPGILANATHSDLQCLQQQNCSNQLLQPVTLTPQPGRVHVINLVQFDAGQGAGGVSVHA